MIAALVLAAALIAQSPETIAEIRVHGNLIATNEDILALSGVTAGAPFTPATIADVTARLNASKRFEDVEVLKRFASIEDASRITIVILVNEGPVRLASQAGTFTAVRRRGLRNMMFMPILDAEDGYGLTYGVRAAHVGAIGEGSRLSFPLTWGGTKQAGADVERAFGAERHTRVKAGAAIERQKNPAFLEEDTRRRAWGRVEHARGYFRGGGTLGWQDVSFMQARDRFRSMGIDAAFDTRVDPVLPRNAVFASASWERLNFESGLRLRSGQGTVDRTRMEGRGYLGLVGPSVLAVRAARESSSGPLPLYLKPLLGGWSTLRGFKAGSFAGDTLVAGSVELRVPLTSPMRVGKLGVSVFADAGKSYDHGHRYRDETLHRSIGAGAWFAATVFHIGVSVAHGTDTRVNFGAGLAF